MFYLHLHLVHQEDQAHLADRPHQEVRVDQLVLVLLQVHAYPAVQANRVHQHYQGNQVDLSLHLFLVDLVDHPYQQLPKTDINVLEILLIAKCEIMMTGKIIL